MRKHKNIEQIRNKFLRKIQSIMLRMNYKRKCRIYCVGAAKTGTHSIAEMFDSSVRASHEPESDALIEKILQFQDKKFTKKEILRYIRKRDRKLCLDVDSSQLNYFLMQYLVQEFDDARFILTIRDPESWLRSFINDSLRRTTTSQWIKMREHRFRASELDFPPEEKILKDKGLYTLDGYLSYWANHNIDVLQTIPEEKLLIINTKEITKNAKEIADFADLNSTCVNSERSHAFRNTEDFYVLEQLDQDYLTTKIEYYKHQLKSHYRLI